MVPAGSRNWIALPGSWVTDYSFVARYIGSKMGSSGPAVVRNFRPP